MPDYLITFQVRVKGEHGGWHRTQSDALKLAGESCSLSLAAIQRGMDFEGDPTVQEVPTPEEETLELVRAARCPMCDGSGLTGVVSDTGIAETCPGCASIE